MVTKLILIRHGSTNWNLEKRYCGFKDVDLSDKGKKEARCLYKRVKREEIHKVYSSDRKRALLTAKIIFKRIKIEKIPGLNEIRLGSFEGLTYDEIMKKYPQIYKKWLKDPFDVNIPNGENLNGFRKRVLCAFKKIISSNHNKTIAVVCHGGAISVFINHILKSKKIWNRIPNLASLSIIEHKNGKAKIRLFNDISHLS